MGKEKSMLTPTIDLFSPMYKKNNLQEKVVESQNGPSSSMAALLPLPSMSSERQSSSYFAFVEEAILVHGRDFSVL